MEVYITETFKSTLKNNGEEIKDWYRFLQKTIDLYIFKDVKVRNVLDDMIYVCRKILNCNRKYNIYFFVNDEKIYLLSIYKIGIDKGLYYDDLVFIKKYINSNGNIENIDMIENSLYVSTFIKSLHEVFTNNNIEMYEVSDRITREKWLKKYSGDELKGIREKYKLTSNGLSNLFCANLSSIYRYENEQLYLSSSMNLLYMLLDKYGDDFIDMITKL